MTIRKIKFLNNQNITIVPRNMNMLKYVRFVNGLQKYLINSQNPDEALIKAKVKIAKRMENRIENFLNIIDKGVFNYNKSPYLPLLQKRKIDFKQIKSMVEKEGIEAALNSLLQEGVYFTIDEFKGKCDVNRNGISFRCNEKMFDNPYLSNVYEVRSGATRSAGTRIRIDFEYLEERSCYDALLLANHDCLKSPIANWFPLFPGAPGINSSLRFLHIGNPPQKWFSQVDKSKIKVNWEKTWGTNLIFFISNFYGKPIVKPEFVDLNNAQKIAKWASQILEYYPNCVIYTFATSALRIALASKEKNINIKGARFFVTGEPLTIQKKKEILDTGAQVVPVYGISEAGVIAAGCNFPHNSISPDHCHIYKDTIAIIKHHLKIPAYDIAVNAFLFSTILYESPKLLLNVGMGDYGNIDKVIGDCELNKIGFDYTVSNIRSYEKMTGEGVTFVDTDFITILEKELPSRFGGTSSDYQLTEEEDGNGINHLNLIINPEIKNIKDEDVLYAFVTLLKNAENSPESWAQSGAEMWNSAKTIRIKRAMPVSTKSGKILPFHLIQK
jgi:hypothetical protein